MKNANMNNMFGHALKVGDVLSTNSGSSYQIIGFINTGKNGAVFKVNRDDFQYNNSYFALKIQYNLLEKRLRRFEREQDFLKHQTSPYLLSYIDSGEVRIANRSYSFVVTPYYPHTLDSFMSARAVSYEQKVRFTHMLLMALSQLKEQSVVHRDIKPQNIFTGGTRIVLGDFGLIKSLCGSDTERSEDILHASASMPRHYRTPELVAYAKKETNRFYMESDAFQIGLVICWLFTGVNPLLASEDKLSSIELCDINKLTGCLDYRIANMIQKMTAIDRTERMSPETALSCILEISREIETAERLVS